MNGKKARGLRAQAKAVATVPYGTTNENIDIKSVKSGKWVRNDDGVLKAEVVPQVTYQTELVDNCARKIYKDLKKESRHVN